MKKIILILLSLFIAIGLCACTPSTSPDPTPDPTPTPDPGPEVTDEVDVSVMDFLKAMRYEEGRWECPGQYSTMKLDFYVQDNRGWVNMIESGEELTEDKYEIISVKYSSSKHLYTARLREEGLDNVNFEMHVDVERLSLGYIKADSNIGPEGMLEYIFTEISVLARYELHDEDVADMYRPYLELYMDGTFIMYENLYEGMGYIYGHYEPVQDLYYLVVTDNSDLQGFAGYETKEIYFQMASNSDALILQTDICYCRENSVFDRVY